MRVLHVINSARPEGGGPIESIVQAQRALSELGHDIEAVSLDEPASEWIAKFDFPVQGVGPTVGPWRYSPRLVSWLREHARRFDCVIVNGIWLFPTFAVWRASQYTGLPYFVYTHGMLDPTLKQVFPFRHRKKALYWRTVEHRSVQGARAVLFTCAEEQQLAAASFKPFKARAEIVPYCVGEPPEHKDSQVEAFLRRFPHLIGKRRILFLSRLHPKKGCDLVLSAFAGVLRADPAFHLVMAGPDDANWRKSLESQARNLRVEHRVTWTGMLTGSEKWGAFRTAEAFVLPSHQENFGIAVVEALACGVPVLITRRVNIWREVMQDQAGFVEEDTVEGAMALLRDWKRRSDADRRQLASRARTCFINRFRSREAAETLLRVLRVNGVQDRGRQQVSCA